MSALPAFALGIGVGAALSPFLVTAGTLAAAWLHERNLAR